MTDRRRPLVVVVLSGLVAVLLAGCVPFPLGPPVRTVSTPVPSTAPPGLEALYSQTLSWEDCGGGLQCSTALAPVDWSVVDGPRIELAIARRPANTTDVRGSLLVDPGGPGASAIRYLRGSGSHVVDAEVLDHYDVVAVDPRGVGQSAPVDCLSDRALDDFLYGRLPTPRGSPAWLEAATRGNEAFAAACAEQAGDLLGHIDTESVARDWDLVRALLGDPALNYLGFSYGTLIGALYADLFPERVGRMVLDGVIDPSLTLFQLTVGQAQGFEDALAAYLDDCLGRDACPFRGSVASARADVGRMLADADARPIRHGDGRELTGATLLSAIVYGLYRDSSWPSLSRMFADVLGGSSDQAFAFADAYNDRSNAGVYQSNQMEAFAAVNCADYPATTDPVVIEQQNVQLVAAAPRVGPWWTYGDLGCSGWPAPPGRTPAPVNATGASPILLVGTTGDPATPYAWAESLAAQLGPSARLLTYEGDVHTAYNASSCVRQLVDRYLLDGSLSDPGARC